MSQALSHAKFASLANRFWQTEISCNDGTADTTPARYELLSTGAVETGRRLRISRDRENAPVREGDVDGWVLFHARVMGGKS